MIREDDDRIYVDDRDSTDTLASIGARAALSGSEVHGANRLLRAVGPDAKRGLGGALAAYAAAEFPKRLALRGLRYADKSSPVDHTEFARALADIQSERKLRQGARPLKFDVSGSGDSFTTSSAHRLIGRGAEMGAPGDVYRGYARVRGGDVNALFHELGHATGDLGYGREAHKKWVPLVGGSRLANKYVHGIMSPVLGALANTADADNIDDLRDYNTALSVASAALSAPTLVEEARASLRARKLAPAFGSKVDTRTLGLRYGQYAADALLPIIGRHMAVSHMLDRRAEGSR